MPEQNSKLPPDLCGENCEKAYRSWFEEAPIPLWDGDFSGVKEAIDQLRVAGIGDLRDYIECHPEVLIDWFGKTKVNHVNRSALALYDASNLEELALKKERETLVEESFEVRKEKLLALAEGANSVTFETITTTVQGVRLDVIVQVSIAPGHEASWDRVLIAITDITERTHAKRALERSNRALQTLRRCHHALNHSEDEAQFLSALCLAVVEEGGYRLAWIGRALHDKGRRVEPIAWAGVEAGYLNSLNITWADREQGRGPTGTAIRTGKPSPVNIIERNHLFAPWRSDALARGYRSSIALPLILHDEVYGALNIYAAETDAFDDAELPLLQELADEVVAGMLKHRAKIERLKSAEGLRRFEAIVSSSTDMMALMDRDLHYLAANAAYTEAFNLTPSALLGQSASELFGHSVFQKAIVPNAAQCLAGKTVSHHTWINFPASGRRYMDVHYYPYVGTDGEISGFVVNGRDITARKQAEDVVKQKQAQLAALLEVSRKINVLLELPAILGTLVESAISLVNASAGAAGLMVGEKLVFSQYRRGQEWHPIDLTFELGQGVPGEVWRTRKPYLTNDAEHDPHVIPAVRQQLNFRQLIDVPIISATGVLLGCFEIHDPRDHRPFSESDIQVLQSLAASAAIALENAQLASDLRQANQTIKAEELRIRKIVDTARDAFIAMTSRGLITDWNPRAEEMFGRKRMQVLGQSVAEMIIPPEHRQGHVRGLEKFHPPRKGPLLTHSEAFEAQHSDGHTFPVELSIAAVQTNGELEFNAFIRDTSLQVHAQNALKDSLVGTILAISKAVEARDPYTAGHQQRVAQLARSIAQELDLDKDLIDGLRMGATIHDIGKIQLPAEILSKPTRLTRIEFELIKCHSQVGFDILKDIRFPWPIAKIAHQHHERLDGSGYPQGLKGDEICVEARITAVADVVEAMASHRPYRPGLGISAALDEIETHRGVRFDAAAVDACLHLFRSQGFCFQD